MSTLNWLEENLHRAYPFTEDSSLGGYRAALADISVRLSAQFAYDLDQDTEQLRLVSIVVSGSSVWTFRHYRNGVAVAGSPALQITLPENPAPLSTWRFRTLDGSLLSLVVGDPEQIVTVSPASAVLEDRVVRTVTTGTSTSLSAYNEYRPGSYRPFFVANPDKSPAQNYLDAVALAPLELKSRGVVDSSSLMTFNSVNVVAGYNATVTGNPEAQKITLGFTVGAGQGRDCEAVTASSTVTGTLRGINGMEGVRGNLLLTASDDFTSTTDQDNYLVTIEQKPLSEATGCGKDTTQQEPPAIQGPP